MNLNAFKKNNLYLSCRVHAHPLCFEGGPIYNSYFLTPNAKQTYPYIPTDKPICSICICALELRFIRNIPIQNLPLWISHPWISEMLYFEQRFNRACLLYNSIPKDLPAS